MALRLEAASGTALPPGGTITQVCGCAEPLQCWARSLGIGLRAAHFALQRAACAGIALPPGPCAVPLAPCPLHWLPCPLACCQVMHINNSAHGQKPLGMRLRLSWTAGGQAVVQQGEVTNFPPGL